ncbi:MAG: aspartate aminotransferase family protein [Calditrichales bacterium]|nr:MAG: aspartate aminotransferase family protein [Calditrichales bacterium]
MYQFNRKPVRVKRVAEKYRRIITDLPVPESLPILEKLEKYEPKSMLGQPPLIWDHAEGFQVYDPWGNMWIDWSSGVLITNAGHSHPAILHALQEQLAQRQVATYVFYHEKRALLVEKLAGLAPQGLDKVYLVSTGSEATENTIKLARTYGLGKYGAHKKVIVSFSNAFHGRTMGAQLAGGSEAAKSWIGPNDLGFVTVPFPDGFFTEDTDFNLFLDTLKEKNVKPGDIAGVIVESYQGAGPFFLPDEYAKKLESFCRKNDALLIMDEVQAGFGRTGRWFTFEHYGITPDLIACGKGISSSLPIAAVIGRAEIMDQFAPGSMTSTHSASPLPVAAALANITAIEREDMLANAKQLEPVLMSGLQKIYDKHPQRIGFLSGRGLVAGLQIVKPGTKDGDAETALRIVEGCFQSGLLMFAPVGVGGMCIKVCPPLVITEEALRDGLNVLQSVCADILR